MKEKEPPLVSELMYGKPNKEKPMFLSEQQRLEQKIEKIKNKYGLTHGKGKKKRGKKK